MQKFYLSSLLAIKDKRLYPVKSLTNLLSAKHDLLPEFAEYDVDLLSIVGQILLVPSEIKQLWEYQTG